MLFGFVYISFSVALAFLKKLLKPNFFFLIEQFILFFSVEIKKSKI